jgi:hypothetical protein
VRGHPLADDQKHALLRLLHYDDATIEAAATPGYRVLKREPGAPLLVQRVPEPDLATRNPWDAILSVENALGLGIEGTEHLDNIPRPADYRQEFERARRAAIPLINIVTGWSDYYRGQFTLRGHDIHKIEQALAIVLDVSVDVVRHMKGKPSAGRPRDVSATEVIRRLRRIFRDWYQGPVKERSRQGAVQSRAQWEKDEQKFLETALGAAKPLKRFVPRLPALLRDPRCAFVEERPATLERLARKVARRRIQKGNPR